MNPNKFVTNNLMFKLSKKYNCFMISLNNQNSCITKKYFARNNKSNQMTD